MRSRFKSAPQRVFLTAKRIDLNDYDIVRLLSYSASGTRHQDCVVIEVYGND
jgi:hypothetical protein